MARSRGIWMVVAWLVLSGGNLLAAQSTTWDMAAAGRFDPTNKTYATNSGQVVVDMGRDGSRCPTGLGDVDGREPVREIRITYTVKQPVDQWLHVPWNPGGSGKEQFEVLCNGVSIGKSDLVDGAKMPYQDQQALFPIHSVPGPNTIVLKYLSGDGLRFCALALTSGKDLGPSLSPNLKHPTLASFEKAIGQPGVLLDSEHIVLFAPKGRQEAARIVLPYLVRAYDELYKIVGVHTKSKLAVYAFPKGHSEVRGGTYTDRGSIDYDDTNLDLAASSEWQQYRVPHVSGFIEEIAHNFVHATNIKFGDESVGWSLGVKVSQIVAPNPILARRVQDTRRDQSQTFQQYKAANHTLPADLPANQSDRIHEVLLWRAEMQYGPNFWPDFFKEVRHAQEPLARAQGMGEDDGRNARYQVTVDCFDKLPKIQFKKMLSDNGVSLTTNLENLHPEKPGWNRKLQ